MIYLATILIMYFAVDHKKIIFKTLDYLQDIPAYLRSYAQGNAPFRYYYLRQSLRYYRNLVKLFPESPEVYSTIGFCYYHLGNLKKAAYYYQKAIHLDDGFLGLHYNLGLIYVRLGKHKQAVESLYKAINTSPVKTLLHPAMVSPYHLAQGYTSGRQYQKIRELEIKLGYSKCLELIALSHAALKNNLPTGNTITDIDRAGLYFYPPFRVQHVTGQKQYSIM